MAATSASTNMAASTSSGKLQTPRENIFRKPQLKNNHFGGAAFNNQVGSEAADGEKDIERNFRAFDVVVDPGSETELKTMAQLEEEKELARRKDSSLTAYMPVVSNRESQKLTRKRKLSEMTQ